MDAYEVGFAHCKKKVARAYPQLDLSEILVVKAMPKDGEEEATTKEEATVIEELATERPEVETAITEGPEELANASEV